MRNGYIWLGRGVVFGKIGDCIELCVECPLVVLVEDIAGVVVDG